VDRVHGAVDHGQSRSTVDRGQSVRRRLAGARRTSAGAHQCFPVTEGEDEPIEAVLGRCSPVTKGEDEPVEVVLGRCSPVTEEWQ
jgi:hypothetical protein